jgi:hypothetical protein
LALELDAQAGRRDDRLVQVEAGGGLRPATGRRQAGSSRKPCQIQDNGLQRAGRIDAALRLAHGPAFFIAKGGAIIRVRPSQKRM